MHHGRSLLLTTLAGALILTAAAASDPGPQGVSPGAVDRIAEVEGRCPTFIWGGVPGAAAYELVVYRLPEERGPDGEEALLSPSDLALSVRLPGGALAWQPDLAQALTPGAEYVWFVRAVTDADTGEASEWSTGRFFSISAVPSVREVEEALMTLQRYVSSGADEIGVAAPVGDEPVTSRPASTGRSATPGREGGQSLKDRQQFTAAILGQIADPSGLAFGVVGFSSSPDGGGIAAANLGGGPDLVLDGAADGVSDTSVYQDRLEVSSPDPRTFSFSNTGGGGLTLDVDGIEVVTTATDRDTVGDLTCGSDELAKWDGSVWACAPDLDTDTLAGLSCATWQVAKWDGTEWTCQWDVDTLTGLACETWQSVKWNGAQWVCMWDYDTLLNLSCAAGEVAKWNGSAWTCAEDEQGFLTAGPGIIIDNGEVRIDPGAFVTTVSNLGTATYTFWYNNSIAIGADGLGLISFYHYDGARCLKVHHCNDLACSSASTTLLDYGGGGEYNSIAIGADGLGLISYYDETNGDLKVAHCDDITCSDAWISTVDPIGDVGTYSSIAIGSDGFGLISYYDVTNGDLRRIHCKNAYCSSLSTGPLDTAGDVGTYTSIAIGADGLGLISYRDVTNQNLKVAHCDDIACSTATTTTIDSSGNMGTYTSIAIGADGLGLISYRGTEFGGGLSGLKVAHCDDVLCTSASLTFLDTVGTVGTHTSIAIGADGLGLISYYDYTNEDLKVAHCSNVTCSSASLATLDSIGDVGTNTSTAIGADGLGLVSYHDRTNGDLKVAHLGIGVP